ncbi:hypothetical protein SAMN04515648_2894 [Phyllobacterium sp. CL33Tsu]|uniref:hypothetical protein n=1 Tax=Phyllobacterium sp. CL33Tsu TaxID=1798191 RepID=UPI0008EF8FC3|nr:hypothetical protein [Phyllobacterium sp. CL33Tsu]SFJ15128.1 hypothetical protein SAMN04515648_2894 [Phyllobacterium sp. CL33Tsu]
MKVSQDYASSFMSATWLAAFLKEHGLKELIVTIKSVRQHKFNPGEKPKYVLSLVDKTMEVPVNNTNAHVLANDLGDDAANWPGNKVVLTTSFGQTPNGPGHIMNMRGILAVQQSTVHVTPTLQPTQGNGYAAASQPAVDQQPQPKSNASAELNDEIPF